MRTVHVGDQLLDFAHAHAIVSTEKYEALGATCQGLPMTHDTCFPCLSWESPVPNCSLHTELPDGCYNFGCQSDDECTRKLAATAPLLPISPSSPVPTEQTRGLEQKGLSQPRT